MDKTIVPITSPRRPITKIPARRSLKPQYGAQFNLDGNFSRSTSGNKSGEPGRLSAQELIRISRTPLFDRAIERISNGVAAMPWTINPPLDLDKGGEKAAKKTADRITKSISHPNSDKQETYTEFVKAVVRDILIFGVSSIERMPGLPDPDFQSFWLWARKVENLQIDEWWQPAQEGIQPRFWYRLDEDWNPYITTSEWIPVYNENLFLIKSRSSSRERVPPSPIEIAYKDMCTWLGLHNYQEETVTKAVRDYMICLKNEGDAGVQAFREYWENNVVGQGEIPIVGGEVDVVKFGARNDSELFPQYSEYLAGLIALVFGLLKRDFGYVDDANYATADVSSQTSFQEGIRPIADAFIEGIDQKAVKYYHKGFSIALADRNPQKELDEAERSDILFDGGIMYLDEARQSNGLAPVPGGSRFKDGRSALADKYEEELIRQQETQQNNLADDEILNDDEESSLIKPDKNANRTSAREKRNKRKQRKQLKASSATYPVVQAKPKEVQPVQLTLF
jgi:hypothetical protein